MRCDDARPMVSAAVDDELGDRDVATLDAHLAGCDACRAWRDELVGLRRALRLTPVGAVPNVAAAVQESLEHAPPARWQPPRRRSEPATAPATSRSLPPRWWLPAASFVAAFALAVGVVGPRGPAPVAAQALAERLRMAQPAVHELSADLEVVEHGWHPDVGVRRYTGRIDYIAPATLRLHLDDRTDYPSPAWRGNDLRVAVDGTRAWSVAAVPCPRTAQPTCVPPEPAVARMTGRRPFADGGVAPLELVVPVASLSPTGDLSGQPDVVDGRESLRITTSAARLAPLLDVLLDHGDWREVHPADDATVWLDAGTLAPLRVEVRADHSAARQRWATASGYDETGGALLLEMVLTPRDRPAQAPADPPRVAPVDAGFTDGAGDVPAPEPSWLPAGMQAHRSGTLTTNGHTIGVRSWHDGRAWLVVEAATAWRGPRAFGDLGAVVRRVPLATSGVAYVGEAGRSVAVHGSEQDLVVRGSVETEVLLRVAAGLGVDGRPLPAGWAGADTLAEARVAVPGLKLPKPPAGLAGPGVDVSEVGVTLGYAGAGTRAFTLTQEPGTTLSPPTAGDIAGVAVRGVGGRWSASRGELTWVEDGLVLTLASPTLTLGELLTVADTLAPAGDGT